jgi:NADH-quinone oxidoreductase subunit A
VAQAVPVRVRPSVPYEQRNMMLSQYLPVLVFILIALALGGVLLGVGALLSVHRPDAVKNAPYECGFPAFESSRIPFDVRFYLVALLFIIFDLETAFFFPWALVLRKLGWFGFAAMGLFLGLLVIGFIYEWKRGALEWE